MTVNLKELQQAAARFEEYKGALVKEDKAAGG
jgi:hypothetical protein